MTKKSKPLSELEKKVCPKVLDAAKIEGERMLAEIRKEETLSIEELEEALEDEILIQEADKVMRDIKAGKTQLISVNIDDL